jgi:2-haloacid dehalogenase
MKMSSTRRKFLQTVGGGAALGAVTAAEAAMQGPRPELPIKVLAFDAYGTLFDVFSVASLCEELFPARGAALTQLWRAKQLQYSLLRSLMGRYQDFWRLTEDGLVYAARSLGLELTADRRRRLMDAYLTLAAFPDVRPGLEALKNQGVRLAILSNGEPKMLRAAAQNAGIAPLLDAVLSVDIVGIFKPSPRTYNLVADSLGAGEGRAGFVSSNSWDIAGAGSAGLTTYWIQRTAAEPQEELGFPASYIVHAIIELSQLV